ncbi:quinol:cytochrome c oxidoreductase quinone-binding subunit 2 [Lutibacter sp. Hel_I_33_5]|uniref:quinol:cytochrome C oxidoreductase n=1 Tax=Lutibacter sp. Hel_I_33_5 TaxID=1566289 RepID=UPI0011A5A261|nr:quinol:cytochrome C oxidoreductase [Lutibacter sp. Hel_I_33_5]TVZ56109.1 quinol:cytochrome c oxidoreductase quinone-binding subunit 2 [Lutibacter sp. Hel_I_33_5]
MYQFSGKLKMFSIILMILGALGIGYGFLTAPKTVEEAKEILAHQAAHGAHGDSHAVENHHEKKKEETHAHGEETHANHVEKVKDAHAAVDSHGTSHDDAHAEHVFNQLQNRPWSAFYVALFFFLGVTLLVLAFYAAQRVAQSGWSIVLFRVMEAITANLVPTSIIMLLVIAASAMHYNHLFSWMAEGTFTPGHDKYDAIVDGKSWWINLPGWAIRSVIYLAIWNAYRWFIRKNSIAEDTANDGNKTYKRNYNISVVFLFLFMLTESMAVWDWIMGLDPHWFSTLFGWYVLATLLVSALTTIAFVTIYLRSKGYLPRVNDSHIHDLAKFMFGFSVFWTYLWFAQFMLIWYADIPEETTYFAMRFAEYKLPFLGMVAMNFAFPILLLINSDFKSIPWFVVIGGLVILAGHYIDVFVMIMPATVGAQWFIGIPELSSIAFFLGIFIYATFSSFAKASAVPEGNPFLKESEHFHYYNIEHRGESAKDHH